MKVNYTSQRTPQFSVLSAGQCEAVYLAALEVLERTGVDYYVDEAIDLLRKAGAVVAGRRVRIPSALIKQALNAAPSRCVLSGRDRKRSVVLESNRVYFGTGSDCPFIVDIETGERRRYTYKDVETAAKIADALPNIDFFMSLGLVSDVPTATYDRHQFLAMVSNCTKPFVVTAVDRDGLNDLYEMSCEIIGGEDEWRKGPLFSVYLEPSSPLMESEEAITKLLLAAEKGIPAVYTPCPIAGATAPATLAGYLTQALAESLSGLVVAYLKKPGLPIAIGGLQSILDMTTMTMPYGCPEMALISAASTDIAKYLKLPMFSSGGCSDAKVPDEQAAAEAGVNLLMAILSGGNYVHDVGYLESGLIGSWEQLVMCDEIIGMVKRIARGITVDDETLAVDVIDAVGPGGNFLGEDHTRRHFRSEFWMPKLMDRWNWETWQANGAKTLGQRVKEKTLEIARTYNPEPIPEDVMVKLKAICARADEKTRSESLI